MFVELSGRVVVVVAVRAQQRRGERCCCGGSPTWNIEGAKRWLRFRPPQPLDSTARPRAALANNKPYRDLSQRLTLFPRPVVLSTLRIHDRTSKHARQHSKKRNSFYVRTIVCTRNVCTEERKSLIRCIGEIFGEIFE